MANISGWSRGTWSEGGYGVPVPVAPTGLSASGAIGDVFITGSALVAEDSVSGTSAIGDVTSEVLQVVKPTSVTGTGQTTSPAILGDANFSITGVSGTVAVGTVDAQSVAEVTGVSSTGSVGTITMTGTANIVPTGVEDTAELGTPTILLTQTITAPSFLATGALTAPTILGDANFTITGVEGDISVGSVVPFAGSDVNVTGEEATATLDTGPVGFRGDVIPNVINQSQQLLGQVGTLAMTGDSNVYLTGVEGIGRVSTPLIWGEIRPNVSTTWNEVAA